MSVFFIETNVSKKMCEIIQHFIDAGVDINASDTNGKTVMMKYTCCYRYSDYTGVVKFLIDSGADINRTDKDGNTALLLAACAGHLDAVNLLVEAGANVNHTNNNGETALLLAASHGWERIPEKDKYADMYRAGDYQNTIKALINAGANINAADHDGWTPLMAMTRDAFMVGELIAAGADINAANNNGQTVLMAHLMHEVCIDGSLLNCQNIDVNARDNKGQSALIHAAQRGHGSVIEKLIERKADLNAADNDGKTAIIIMVEKVAKLTVENSMRHEELAELHREQKGKKRRKKLDVLRMEVSEVVAGIADNVISGHLITINNLLEAGANPNAADNDGKTALALAQEHGLDDVAALLRAAGATETA